MFLTFPNFNLYSTPLLVLVSQGVIFGVLLLVRYGKYLRIADLFLALLVLITCYHRTTYTIGFMDWYDTFRNTKINYWLIYLGLALGPLIYFYVKAVTSSDFKFKRKHWLHFLPVFLYVIYRVSIFAYDARQDGFSDTQNGVLMSSWEFGFMGVFTEVFFIVQHLLYLAFTFQLFYQYRKGIDQYFSNTYKLELNWIRNFLYLYAFLFLYSLMQQMINLSVTELSWIQKWWYQLFSALVVIYIGIKGYFTDTTILQGVSFDPRNSAYESFTKKSKSIKKSNSLDQEQLRSQQKQILEFIEREKPYLDPELNLKDLAEKLSMSRAQLSEIVNSSFNKNFNDFINEYRVENVKSMLAANKQQQLSLLGIAYESGFNSKATFNRVFRKLTHSSPTEYLKNNS